MTVMEKIQNAINNKNIKLSGALFAEFNDSETVAKIFDMNYTTFHKKPIGVYFVGSNQLAIY